MNHLSTILLLFALGSTFEVILPNAVIGNPISTNPGLTQQETERSEADKLLQAAATQFRQGRFEDAIASCTKASALNPNDFRAYTLSGLAHMAQMKFKSASEAFANAIRLQPQTKEFYLLKASADASRHATEEALEACRKALEIDPKYAEAYAMIGQTLRWNEKRRAEAIAAYESAIKINPDLFLAYERLGELLASEKQEKRAEEMFRQGMATDPNHMSGRFALGRILVKQGRLSEARAIWEGRTSEEDNTFPQFIQLLTRAENLKRATEALAQKPKDPEALVEMGLAVMDGDSWVIDGRQERAITYFREALKRKANYARAQYGICKAYIQIADMAKDDQKTVDKELAKLRKLDAALANELDQYRKKYKGAIIGTPVNVDQ